MAFTFTIDAVPPSLNRLMRERTLRIHAPLTWKALVRSAARSCPAFRIPVRITLTFHKGTKGRPVDPDNHAKCALDGIVAAGLIADDRWPYVAELVLRGRPAGEKGREWTEVTIESVEPGRG